MQSQSEEKFLEIFCLPNENTAFKHALKMHTSPYHVTSVTGLSEVFQTVDSILIALHTEE